MRTWRLADHGTMAVPRTRRAVLAPASLVPLPATPPPSWPGEAVRIDGAVTYVRRTPPVEPGLPPALYLHGLGGSATNWTDLAGLLAPFVAGAAIDLPGAGRSDPAPRYSLAAMAERVARFIEHDGRGPVHLLGNSLGGTVAVQLAATRPELVRTLTLIAPAMPFLNPRRSVQSRLVPLLAIPRAERVARRLLHRMTPEELARRVVRACFADPDRIPPQRFAEAVADIERRYTVDHYVPAYVATMRGLVTGFLRAYLPGRTSLWRLAATIRVPTLVIGGQADRLVDVRVPARTAWTIPDSRLLMLQGVGHVPQMEVPQLVARAVVGLLREVKATPTAVAD